VAFDFNKNKRLFELPASGVTPLVKLQYYEQIRSWLFSVGTTGYFVELYIVQQVDVKASDPSKADSKACPWPRQEHWGIRVFHERWDRVFKENQELGIGEKTKWEPTEAQFFPSEDCLDYWDMEGTEAEVGAGFQELMRVLKVVEDIATGRQEAKKQETEYPGTIVDELTGAHDNAEDSSDAQVSYFGNGFISLLD
jgi:hypothetical protein